MLGKAPGLGADMVFLDLEDSVAPLEKEAARDNVVKAINELDWGDTVVCVRVNAWDTKWTYRDVVHVVENASERLDELMLPKVQSASEVIALDLLLTQIEQVTGPRVARRHRGADRDRARPHQRRRDLRRVTPHGDDRVRAGRLRRLHRDARAHRRRADPGVPG